MRVTLDISEATALLAAISLDETSLLLQIKKHRKLNQLEDLGAVAGAYADLQSAKEKIRQGLAADTRTEISE